jgi:serine/threonine-protein kinase
MNTDDSRIIALVEEILESGKSPEDACRDCPELLPTVRHRLRKFRSVEAELGAMFPPRSGSGMSSHSSHHRIPDKLPIIPGYQVEEQIGSGGMGVVYRARHLRLNRLVALKMMIAGGFASPRDLERFKREAEAVAALRHPNIVQVYDAGEHECIPYFTMEFMEGGTLVKQIAGTPQPAKDAAGIVAVLARAVDVAHQNGIVHCDIKPGNVLRAADGTPKIADFGLARRLEGGQGETVMLEGGRAGTPSYMAPEQITGPSGGPGSHARSVDIYGLGALLYEMLTGRPPFRGESPAETQRQVMRDEPIPPGRLNPRTPRDLATICLKCLQKDPQGRYATALDLAEDLERFLTGNPIKARPVSALERMVRWTRRNPAPAGLILAAAAMVVVAAVLGVGAWRTAAKRTAEVAAWTPRLELAEQFESTGRLPEARALLQGPLDVEDPRLRNRIRETLTNLELARKLEGVRDARGAIVNGRFDYPAASARSDKSYEAVFLAAGLGKMQDQPGEVAGRIAQSPIRSALVAALDDWWGCTTDEARMGWIMDVACRADPDPSGWRERVRRPAVSRDDLEGLADRAVVQEQSPQLLVSLGLRMRKAGADVVPFLDRVQRRYPGDFWACYTLGEAHFDKNPPESVRYFQAALASHPESALGHHALGRALGNVDRMDESQVHFREALRLEPAFAEAMSDLGWGLVKQGRGEEGLKLATDAADRDGSAKAFAALGATFEALGRNDDAIGAYRRAIAADPSFFWSHFSLAKMLDGAGRPDECMAELETCRRLRPDSGWVYIAIAGILKNRGRIDDAMVELNKAATLDAVLWRASAHAVLGDCWRAKGSLQLALMEFNQSLLLNPAEPSTLSARREVLVQLGLGEAARAEWEQSLTKDSSHDAWDGYADLCIYLGNQDAYESACHELLERFGSSRDPRICEHTGRACLVGLIGPADCSRAQALVERAVNTELTADQAWIRPYFRVAEGLARYRHKDFNGAVEAIDADSQKVLGPFPHLVLAMAHQSAGRRADALRCFEHALAVFDWDASRMKGSEEWMFHTLRREAERTVMPNLDAMLAGRAAPRDQDERLALVAVCQTTKRYAMAAALCAEAFDADPSLAGRVETGRRYDAACWAARAGRGDGRDGESLNGEQRARWRKQARAWLRGDLAEWAKASAGDPKDRERAHRTLMHWQSDPDLAGLREPALLAALEPAERDECSSIWSEVDRVIGRAQDSP